MTRHWPLAVVLIVQIGVLVYLPAGQVRARLTGTEVTLRTAPVDPYDVLSGYYMTHNGKGQRMFANVDFGLGSSGGPVLNEFGQAVGMVSATTAVKAGDDCKTHDQSNKYTQMTFNYCVPAESIVKLTRARK